MQPQKIPLCVDLDGTLVRSDTLWESLLRLFKQHPAQLLMTPLWLARGRAYLKQAIAQRTALDPVTLPYNAEFLQWLRLQKVAGRRLVLCTAADRKIAESVAAHLGIFDEVLASDGAHNLRGEAKCAELCKRYGERSYDYAGNDASDLAVWRSARQATLVTAPRTLEIRAKNVATIEKIFAGTPATTAAWIKAIRLHQWVKNLLIFLPPLLAHRLDAAGLQNALLGFLAFGLCASSVYLLNDLLDLDADRSHPRKRDRAFASGTLPLSQGIAASLLLLALAFTVAVQLPIYFVAVLVFYTLTTLAYSLRLKRVTTLDVMLLAGLYTLRVIAGGAAADVGLSFWLLAFSMFLFLSLGVVKRYAELRALNDRSAPGRGYHADDLPMLRSMGISAGYSAVLVLALYINSPQSQALYAHPTWLWLVCPLLLYWISRVWMKTHRGQMHDDPIVFALRDPISWGIASITALIIYLAA